MKLIDKDALVAEIWKRRNKHFYFGGSPSSEYCHEDNEILGVIDTLEVKEVDLEKEIKDYFNNQPIITKSKGTDYQLIPSGEEIAKHFFSLGLKAQKGEEV